MLKYLRGIDIPAPLVGFARGALEAFVMAGLAALILTWQNTDFHLLGLNDTTSLIVGGGGVWVWRTVEGIADHIDPSKPRAP